VTHEAPGPPPGASSLGPEAARRNFRLTVWNGVLFQIGEAFTDGSTVVALLVSRLTDRNSLVGLAVSLQEIGWYLPQILTIHVLERRSRRLPIYAAAGAARMAGLAIVTAGLFAFGDRHPSLALAAFFAGFTLYAFAGGFAAVSFYDVVSRTVPLTELPRLWAVRLFFGGACAAATGPILAPLLGLPSFALRFGTLFAIGSAFIGLGILAFLRCQEPAVEVSKKALAMGAHLRESLRHAWRDPAFRALYASRVALAAAAMATPFFVVFATRRLGLPVALTAGFLIAKLAGFVGSNLVWQRVALGRGHRSLMRRVAVAAAVAPLCALAALVGPPAFRAPLVFAAFAIAGASVSGTSIAFQSLLIGIAPAARRPSYVGWMNSFVGPATALPALAGVLVDAVGDVPVLALAIVCAGIAWAVAGGLPQSPVAEAMGAPGREGESGSG
jgi:MFS family permease